MMFARTIAALVTLAGISSAQFLPAPTDLTEAEGYAGIKVRYKEVPAGTCEMDPNVKSYSGYADVSEDQHIFWWFFEARVENASSAPLTVWINGGPGSSSMIGLFQELGPCFVDIDGNPYDNPYSWSNVSNMLFIDQPTQTGFSYSIPVPMYTDPISGSQVRLPDNTCPDYAGGACGTMSYYNISLTQNTTTAAAPNMWKTLQGFMGAFPQYSQNEFFFATESYGGHYAPIFNEYIVEQNENLPEGAKEINLAAVLIGNGWYDPLIQYGSFYNFTVYPGNTYDYEPFNQTIIDYMYNSMYGPGNCADMVKDCYARGIDAECAFADNFCYQQVEYVLDVIAGRDEYDIRELTPDPFPPEFYSDYLNTPKLQQAIGAFTNFSRSPAVSAAFAATGDDARVLTSVSSMSALLDAGVSVIMYFGDADYICNWIGGEAVSHLVQAPGYSAAGFADIKTSDGIAHGVVKQAGSFAFVRIYESGHEVPFYQPLAALEMFERVVNGVDIATGMVEAVGNYSTEGPKTSEYINGNATMVFEVLPTNATYNTTTNRPNPIEGAPPSAAGSSKPSGKRPRSLKPRWQRAKLPGLDRR